MKVRLSLLLLVVPLGALAQDKVDLNTITKVEVKGGSVEITGSKKPNFTTFTMTDPPRLVIDISEAVFSGVPEELQVGNGVVTAIKTASYGSDAAAIARVLIGYEKDVETDLQTVGDTKLVVKVVGGGGAAVAAAAPPAEKPADDGAKAAAEKAAADKAAAEAQASAEKEKAAKEAQASAEKEKTDKETAAKTEKERLAQEKADKAAAAKAEKERIAQEKAAEKERVAQEKLAAKERAAQEKADKVAAAKAEKERVAQEKADRLAEAKAERERLAQEKAAAKAAPAAEEAKAEAAPAEEAAPKVSAAEEKKLAAQQAKEAAAEKKRAAAEEKAAAAQQAKEAAAEKKRLAAEEKAAAAEEKKLAAQRAKEEAAERKQTKVAQAEHAPASDSGSGEISVSGRRKTMQLVGFKQEAGGSRVFVRTNEPVRYTVSEAGDKTLVLELENTRIANNNDHRPLDTSYFDTAVAMISPKEGSTRSVKIQIKLKENVAYQAKQTGNEVFLEFQKPGQK